MESIDDVLKICDQLRLCTNQQEVNELRSSVEGSTLNKKGKKVRDRDSHKNDGNKKPRICNLGKSRMLSCAETSREMYNIIKDIDNLIKEVKEPAKKDKFGDDLTIEGQEEMKVKFPTSNLVGQKFDKYKNEISLLLIQNKALTIGVWGMGGVGKTTLVKHLHNMLLDQHDIYGSIYWITISKDCSIRKLQDDIARRMNEDISNESDQLHRAGILRNFLKRKKKFVIILDDMWSDFDLNEVGLGSPKENGYQLILTSRSRDVCSKMYCDNIIKVDPLSQEDAETLFAKSIGREIPNDLVEISIDVVKECGGLPLGIIVLAKSLSGCNDFCEWTTVLDELRNSRASVDDMEEKVFKVLRLSYERLKDCEVKKFLLYCATYPEDCWINIEELIWLFIDEGLLGKNNGLAKMFDKGLATLKKLERAALISIERNSLEHFDWEYVRLHDLIRDMVLQIVGSSFMIKAQVGLKDIPEEENWTNELVVVSLQQNGIREIRNSSPNGKWVSTLMLQGNSYLCNVSDCFFNYLHELKNLNLSGSSITTLPESISSMKNLTALILRRCRLLEHVPSLEAISSLEKLDLYRTRISQLPKGVGRMIKLRYLNFYKTRMKTIDEYVLKQLTALRYLAMEARFNVEELGSLNNLEYLVVLFHNFLCFYRFIELMKINDGPKSYIFQFQCQRCYSSVHMRKYLSEKHCYLRQVDKLDDNNTIRLRHFEFGDISDCAYDLLENKVPCANKYNQLLKRLFGHHNTSSDCFFSDTESSPGLESRVKHFCESMLQNVLKDIHSLEISRDVNFTSLRDFVFDTGCNLQIRSEIDGVPKPFSNLKCLGLYCCPKPKMLFPLGLLSNLQNIEEIRVNRCEGLEELIEGEDDETVGGVGRAFPLPKLKCITLGKLPNLRGLCRDDRVICTPALRWIRITRCLKLKRMALDVDNQHQLLYQYLEEEETWLESLEWDPLQSKTKMDFQVC